jgi:hypothetical protein
MTLLEKLTERIGNLLKYPGTEVSGKITLTSPLTALDTNDPPKACTSVTLVNATGGAVSVSVGGGAAYDLPDGGGQTFYVTDLGKIKVSGSGDLGYTFTY